MPRHRFTPRVEPPGFWDRVYSHPFETSMAGLWTAAGVLMVVASFIDYDPSHSLSRAAPWATFLLGVMLFIGAAGVIHGLFVDSNDLVSDWLKERLGLLLGGLGLLGYSTAVGMTFPWNILSWLTPLMMAIACLIRIRATFLEEATRRADHEEWRAINDGDS